MDSMCIFVRHSSDGGFLSLFHSPVVFSFVHASLPSSFASCDFVGFANQARKFVCDLEWKCFSDEEHESNKQNKHIAWLWGNNIHFMCSKCTHRRILANERTSAKKKTATHWNIMKEKFFEWTSKTEWCSRHYAGCSSFLFPALCVQEETHVYKYTRCYKWEAIHTAKARTTKQQIIK